MLFWALAEEFSIDAVVLEQPVSRTALLKNRLRRLGASTVAGQVAFQALVAPALRWAARERLASIRQEFNLRIDAIAPHLLRPVDSANSERTVELLRQLRPKVVVVSGTRILSKRVLGCTDAPFINMHAGITPSFRGVHGGYWALAERRRELCGVTIHLVDAGVDTGAILGQALIAPTADDNFITYPVLQLAAGIPLLKDAVRAFLRGAAPTPLAGGAGPSRQWYHPTAWGYIRRRLIDHVR
jgi:folate-dependent phosphoribosylglycinamide formyltransferase PurN